MEEKEPSYESQLTQYGLTDTSPGRVKQRLASIMAQITGVLDQSLQKNVLESKVLMVGAGGIGCELLKNLVLTGNQTWNRGNRIYLTTNYPGFKDIVIIDLDTIDVSNLNRQFLFQKQHVGKSKSACAKEAALRFEIR